MIFVSYTSDFETLGSKTDHSCSKHICLSQKGQLSFQVNPLSTDVGTTELGLTKEYRQTDRHGQLFLLYIVDE